MLIVAAVLAATGVPACPATALALRFDAGGGDFNGMSHSGAYALITNRSARACTLPALPAFAFRDARGRLLPIARQVPVGMHPGPVLLPVRLAPGATARTGLRWVSGPVFDHSRCWDVRRGELTLGPRRVVARLAGHVCGEGARATFEQPPLQPFSPSPGGGGGGPRG